MGTLSFHELLAVFGFFIAGPLAFVGFLFALRSRRVLSCILLHGSCFLLTFPFFWVGPYIGAALGTKHGQVTFPSLTSVWRWPVRTLLAVVLLHLVLIGLRRFRGQKCTNRIKEAEHVVGGNGG